MSTLKDKLESYAPVPDEKLWDGISSSLAKNRIRRRVTAASAVVAVGVGGVALFLALNSGHSSPATNTFAAVESHSNVAPAQNATVIEPEAAADILREENTAIDVRPHDFAPADEVAFYEPQTPVVESSDEVAQAVETHSVPSPAIVNPAPVAAEPVTVVEPDAKSEAKPAETSLPQEPQRRINPKLPPQELAVWIPNAFSPDDPVEESARIFKVTPNNDASIRSFEIYIYSRSGRLVFHSKDINEGWDGTAKGQKQPMGTYVYIIELNDAVKGLQHTKGSITLLR